MLFSKIYVPLSLLLFTSIFVDGYLTNKPTKIARYLKTIYVDTAASGMPNIDCIYLINLDERPDRLEKFYGEFSSVQFKINRVSAVNGWKLPEKVFKKLGGPYGPRISPGHLGCLLSHVSVLHHAYKAQWDTIWVLEDDATILENVSFIPTLIEELNTIDPQWDVLFTDTDYRKGHNTYIRALATNARPDQPIFPLTHYTQKTPVSPHLLRIYNRYATTSMILSKRGIEKLFKYFTHVYIWQPIDIDMHYVPGIKEYTPVIDIVSNSVSSDSNTSHSTK